MKPVSRFLNTLPSCLFKRAGAAPDKAAGKVICRAAGWCEPGFRSTECLCEVWPYLVLKPLAPKRMAENCKRLAHSIRNSHTLSHTVLGLSRALSSILFPPITWEALPGKMTSSRSELPDIVTKTSCHHTTVYYTPCPRIALGTLITFSFFLLNQPFDGVN